MPWAIGAGAQLDASVARTFTNIATQDTEGVNLPGDFQVTALPTAGPQVQIAGGGMTLRNYQQPGESYVGASTATTTVDISANTSGATRYDMVVARVIDPDFSPWQPYTDPQAVLTGPYFEPFVVSGVSATAATAADAGLNYSALALARLALPNGTTNVDGSMITDLRQLARPRTWIDSDLQQVASQQQLTSTTWVDWPSNSLSVTVPDWATQCQAIIRLNGILGYGGGPGADAYVRVNFDGLTGPSAVYDFNAPSNLASTDAMMIPISAYGKFDVTSLQGQTLVLKPQAERYSTDIHPNQVEMDVWHQVEFNIRFFETP